MDNLTAYEQILAWEILSAKLTEHGVITAKDVDSAVVIILARRCMSKVS
jgi:hypothetical protein